MYTKLKQGMIIETPSGLGECCDFGLLNDGTELYGFRLYGEPSTRIHWFATCELELG